MACCRRHRESLRGRAARRALLYISQSRDVWLGGGALLSMALGMACRSSSSRFRGALLPKSGAWMTAVKKRSARCCSASRMDRLAGHPGRGANACLGALLIGSAMFLRAIDRCLRTRPVGRASEGLASWRCCGSSMWSVRWRAAGTARAAVRVDDGLGRDPAMLRSSGSPT